MSTPIFRVALATAALLMVPLALMQFTDEVAWTPGDFVVAGTLLFGAGLAYALIAERSPTARHRAVAGLAIGSALLLTWVGLAV